MLQHLHHHRLDRRHLHKREALLQQLFQLGISVQPKSQKSWFLSELRVHRDSPVGLFALRNDGNSLHQILPKLIEDGLMELQARCSVEVEEGQRGLEGRQQDAVLHLQPSSFNQLLLLSFTFQYLIAKGAKNRRERV